MGAKATSGYSGTPLAKKLGIKEGFTIRLVQTPEAYFSYFQYFPEEIRFVKNSMEKVHFIHYFPGDADTLEAELPALREQLVQDGMIWISWPKKSARKQTDLSGNTVRQIGLRHGLVDVKVCSVNEVWSALKFVIPVKDRKY